MDFLLSPDGSLVSLAVAAFLAATLLPLSSEAALFAVLKLRSGHTVAALPEHPVMRRWWDAMAPLMEVEPGNRPKEWPLRQVFHLP